MFGALREIIISRATSGGRREIELNSGSLPPIPGGLATLISSVLISLIEKIPLVARPVISMLLGQLWNKSFLYCCILLDYM